MDATELDLLLNDLETRVERLRALYEQYFLGIEKIPPQVAQKDVDRRLYALRREQIRNTARRFKLQTIIQRYNTFQQYWMRIMREIENGTYRRHVLRAERTVGLANILTPAERKRLGLPEQRSPSTVPHAMDEAAEAVPLQPAEPPLTPPVEGGSAPGGSKATEPQNVRAEIERELGLMLDDDLDDLDTRGHFELGRELDDPLLSSMPPPIRKRKPSIKPATRRSSRPHSENQVRNAGKRLPPSKAPPDQLDRSARPSATGSKSKSPQDPSARRGSQRPSRFNSAPIGPTSPGGLRLPATSAVAGRGLPPPPKVGIPRGAPARVPSQPIIAIEDKPRPTSATRSSPHIPKVAPRPPRSQVSPVEVRLSEPRRSGSATQGSRPQSSGGATVGAGRTGPQAGRSPSKPFLSPPRAAQPPPEPKPRAIGAGSSRKGEVPTKHGASSGGWNQGGPDSTAAGLDREKVEVLASKLRAARMETREAAAVSVDALAKKLQATTDELSKKHSGRRIDFDVVIRDGKAIVKPIVR